MPLLGLLAAARLSSAPRTRAIAHLVVAAPPLFSLLGGWLDFQHALPIRSLTVWIPLWCVAVVLALLPAAPEPYAMPASRRIAVAHGISAAAITLFALPHLANHLAGLLGGDVHVAVMSSLRGVYRHALVEPVLLAAVGFQVVSGAWLLRRKLARSVRALDGIQTASGAYLLVFLLSHVSAALRARGRGIDPNWQWLGGDELLSDPWSVRLVPYYYLAVVALGAHAGCGLATVARGHRIAVRDDALVAATAALAAAVALVILIGLFRA